MGFIKKEDIDLKWIFIIVLGAGLLLSLIFRQGDTINTGEDEINRLNKENTELKLDYDSVNVVKDSLATRVTVLIDSAAETGRLVNKQNNEINRLNDRRYEVSTYVTTLRGDSVAPEWTKYFQRRGSLSN